MKKLYFILFAFASVFANAQNIFTITGGGLNYADGIPAKTSKLTVPYGPIAMDPTGNIYISCAGDNKIRKIDRITGLISTVAGTGNGGYNGDNIQATTADLNYPHGIAFDKQGNLFIADDYNSRIRKIDVFGVITTVAGNGTQGFFGDTGPATSAMLSAPFGIVLDTLGNIYFSDAGNQRIRKVNASNGVINTIAGTGVGGYNGDGGLADTTKLNSPQFIAIDKAQNIYIADASNNRVRKITASTGIMTTVAGNNGITGNVIDGIPAVSSELSNPVSVSLDSLGNLYIADYIHQRIRKVNALGIISTIAGTGATIYNGDGIPATTATLNYPTGVHVDKYGNVYITDTQNGRLREIFANNTSTTLVNSTCNGLCNGSVSSTAFGGKAPYTFSWTGGLGTGASHSNVCAGTYTLTVMDADSLQQISIVTITQPAPITLTITTIDATCGPNGTASAVVVGGVAPYTYSWPGGSISTSSTGLAIGNYSLTVNDSNNCPKVQTFTISLNPNLFIPVPICMVTVDSLSKNNIIIWDKTPYTNIDSFIIYRETSANIYNRLGAVPFGALSQFSDTVRTMYFPNTGDPNSGTYRYKLEARDTCANYTQLSPYHNTIFIINNGSGTFYWTQLYTIENGANPASNYVLYRDDNSNGNWHTVTSVAGTQQTINDPLYNAFQNTASWRVQTQWNITCTPTMRIQSNTTSNFSTSFSNAVTNNPNAIKNNNSQNVQLSIYPNPSNGKITLRYELCKVKGSVEVFNLVGDKVYSQEDLPANQTTLDLSSQPSGIYFLHLKTVANTTIRKIVVQ